jgi:3-oxoacyl-[acyl-carrier-protein] synthase III
LSAIIRSIEYHLPAGVLSNDDLAVEFGDWSAAKISEKTGIVKRHICAEGECASDLAFAAAEKLFASGVCNRADIDYLILCTQSPDYILPTTACLLQHRLGLSKDAGAFDFNLGCSGYVYGLGLAKGLIATQQARNVLLLTAETYSKFIHPKDRSVRTLFGDAAAATLIQDADDQHPGIGEFSVGTDGSGANNLIVPAGGLRTRSSAQTAEAVEYEHGNVRSANHLYMNGPEIFAFTQRVVPNVVKRVLEKSQLTLDSIDYFVFHQANQFLLDHLRKKLRIPEEKFCVFVRDCGNTVSSTIPIALSDAHASGALRPGMKVMLVGFGVGYSWGAVTLTWA